MCRSTATFIVRGATVVTTGQRHLRRTWGFGLCSICPQQLEFARGCVQDSEQLCSNIRVAADRQAKPLRTNSSCVMRAWTRGVARDRTSTDLSASKYSSRSPRSVATCCSILFWYPTARKLATAGGQEVLRLTYLPP